MDYEIMAGQTQPVVDQDGNPLPTAGVSSVGGALPPYGPGLAATMHDDGAGQLVCTGNFPGEVTFVLTVGGTTAEHVVTVVPSPFDWSLGDEVPA